MKRSLIAVALLMAIAPRAAYAIPTPHAPSIESLRDSRPLFTWDLAPNESVNTIEVSSSFDTTPDGEFFDENRVTGDALSSKALSWQPTSRIAAGDYYWHLQWSPDDYSSTGYTQPAAFTIPLQLASAKVGVHQYSSLDDAYLTYSVVTNAASAVATCTVYRGKRIVKRSKDRLSVGTIGSRSSDQCDTTIPERLDGTMLRAVVIVVAGSKSVTASKVFRAS